MKTYNQDEVKTLINDLKNEQRKFKRFVVFMMLFSLILSGITGVASYTLAAGQVGYTARDTSWTVDNTQDAIDELRDTVGAALVGSIYSYMGNNAPFGYLPCDGTEYNITDYPRLAEHFISEFGSANYFGGDGSTTFKVPDLRGEFLRGTGTNSHTNQGSGSNVGTHQDGTYHYNIYNGSTVDPGLYYYIGPKAPNSGAPIASDATVSASSAMGNTTRYGQTSNNSYNVNQPALYTSRPTNTSVLYIIKY